MRNLILAGAAAVSLAAGTAPSLADTSGSSNTFEQCPNILANPTGYPASMAAYCSGSDPQIRSSKRHIPRAVRAHPMFQDNGPTIALPG
jgi:hypothetical protein